MGSATGSYRRLGHHYHCLHCQPCRYIRLVQHLIEKCLTVGMDRHECARAIASHAGIHHSVTATVWDELAKENPRFFRRYLQTLNKQTQSQALRH
ncbi:unnamed protein product [Spirodela intermedia]|uniref:Uncharacterized protein n=1 Tax=Spirodela intermedia TaxID=51605 RepID=A0A7I8KLL9_SPIIN|nr:unnamed protein product [Spirodela intermedia]